MKLNNEIYITITFIVYIFLCTFIKLIFSSNVTGDETSLGEIRLVSGDGKTSSGEDQSCLKIELSIFLRQNVYIIIYKST